MNGHDSWHCILTVLWKLCFKALLAMFGFRNSLWMSWSATTLDAGSIRHWLIERFVSTSEAWKPCDCMRAWFQWWPRCPWKVVEFKWNAGRWGNRWNWGWQQMTVQQNLKHILKGGILLYFSWLALLMVGGSQSEYDHSSRHSEVSKPPGWISLDNDLCHLCSLEFFQLQIRLDISLMTSSPWFWHLIS